MRCTRTWSLTALSLGIALALLSFLWIAFAAIAQSGAHIEVLAPAPGEILEDEETITVTLHLTCENIYGYHFVVTFDPALVQAQAAGFDDTFLLPDFRPPGWDATIDNVAGTVSFATTQFRPAEPVTGTGSIGWVRFIGVSAATLPADALVEIDEPSLATRDGDRIIPSVTAGTIRVLPKAVVNGSVQLQGRSDWSLAEVSMLPSGLTQTTGADGLYSFTLRVDTYTATVEMERYLDAERVFTLTRGLNLLPMVRLLGGDVNSDDWIDILDISAIGGKYGFTVDPLTENADINADGKIDILDISVTGGNFWVGSPVPWN
jgi:hypothetical protein